MVLHSGVVRSYRTMRAAMIELDFVVVVVVVVVAAAVFVAADRGVLDGLLVNASDRVFLLGASQVRPCDRLQ